jgi:hypothetical protein
MNIGKERHFFTNNYASGVESYLKMFSSKTKKQIAIDTTPYYICHPAVPKRVFKDFPYIKLVVLLRNPIDRAYSHWNLAHRIQNVDPHIFPVAINKEEKRIAGGGRDWQVYSYKARGLYAEQLERWFKLFPREQFLIIQSEVFFKQPRKIYQDVCAFLGIPHELPENFKFKPYQKIPAHRIPQDAREVLVEYFKPHNTRLYELLGVDYEWA